MTYPFSSFLSLTTTFNRCAPYLSLPRSFEEASKLKEGAEDKSGTSETKEEIEGVAGFLNCTNLDLPPEPPASAEHCDIVLPRRGTRRKKQSLHRKSYRPNPSFPLWLAPELQRLAADRDMSVAAFIVTLCTLVIDPGTEASELLARIQNPRDGAGGRGTPPDLTAEQWRQLYGLHNNLNQIAKKMHATGQIDPNLAALLLALAAILGVEE